ncbi:MAG TPA: AIR synthase-related protein, partial [Methanomassiliicoccaceae archaeon]|nr:AIR synthase-related protein [Methanomassiliicoccaceae archaeon]
SLRATIGLELLTPTEIYVQKVLRVVAECDVHGMVDVTGGGLRNFLRLREGVGVVIDDPLPAQPVFDILANLGKISVEEQYQTFNMGMGFAIILPEEEADKAKAICGDGARVVGHVVDGSGVSAPSLDISYAEY